MYTYQFNYSSSVDGFGTIQFCSYKKKKATDPSMEEAIEKELRELREKDSEPVAE